MSKLSSPNYCSCTVNQARNLPDKGKHGGIDAFCTISMGKEKFVTAVVEKTTAPDWHEQCDMPIVDDATIKLTVYHKNKNSFSKGDLVGRAYVSLRDLQDYDRVHTNWYKLANKDGKFDKERGEIEVSLQFYSKNNTTGSVLDLATKKKHLSLKDIKHSLGGKLKLASKDRKNDKHGGENELADQRRRLGGDDGSTYNVRDFLDDSASETTSYAGSNMSLNSMNVGQQKKKSRAPTIETPRSSHRSVTSDYETSSILDSSSMYGADETSTPSSSIHSQQREVNIDENKSTKKKTKAPIPTIITTKLTDSPVLTERNRSFTAINEIASSSDILFGLSTIKESIDTDENMISTNNTKNEEIDFDNYFTHEQKTTTSKKSAPTIPQSKSKEPNRSTSSQSYDIRTPSASISIKTEPNSTSTQTKQSDNTQDSTDEDVDELLGKLENNNHVSGGYIQTPTNRKSPTVLPDIVVGPKVTTPLSQPKKPGNNGLSVLGYDNVKSVPVNPKVREELNYLDRDDLLHVIAYQSDLIKKRDTRLKDLEHYTDNLLVKIVEQCPTILQVGSSSRR